MLRNCLVYVILVMLFYVDEGDQRIGKHARFAIVRTIKTGKCVWIRVLVGEKQVFLSQFTSNLFVEA